MTSPRPSLLLACLLVAWILASASAQGGLAYTVQIAALSDPESAIGQSGALLRDGFPAYVVRAEGAAGTVFRVRVGAFGDRASADRYARAMGERAGGTPRPALAEAIPAGILPLAPTRLTRLPPGERAVLLPWDGRDAVALRLGPAAGEGRYEVLGGGPSFEAWWAAPTEGGREEVVRIRLDDETPSADPAEVREALFRQRLRLVAERSGLAEDLVAEGVRGEPGGRYLIAWRTVGESEVVHGLMAAGATPDRRDAEAWLGETPPDPAPPLRVLQTGEAWSGQEAPTEDVAEEAPEEASADDVADSGDAGDPGDADGSDDADESAVAEEADAGEAEEAGRPADEDGAASADANEDDERRDEAGEVAGDGWSAERDGRWTTLRVGDVSWRALIGVPREGLSDLLVLEVDEALEIVRLVPR